MKVGVLGITGMLGHHAARALVDRGHEIIGLCRSEAHRSRLEDLETATSLILRTTTLDHEDALVQAFEGLDGVIHAAAYYPTAPQRWTQERTIARAQMQRFLNACRRSKISKAVYVGGSIALNSGPLETLVDEHRIYPDPPPIKNGYVQAKWVMDHEAALAAADGVPISIAIPSMTLGPYDFGPSTGQVITRVARAQMPGYVNGRRNVIAAEDAGLGIARVLEDGQAGHRYLLTGNNTDFTALIGLICQITGANHPPARPLGLVNLMSKIQRVRYQLGGPTPLLSDTAMAILTLGRHLDGTKAKQDLGFEARWNLEDTVNQAIDWFRSVNYIN